MERADYEKVFRAEHKGSNLQSLPDNFEPDFKIILEQMIAKVTPNFLPLSPEQDQIRKLRYAWRDFQHERIRKIVSRASVGYIKDCPDLEANMTEAEKVLFHDIVERIKRHLQPKGEHDEKGV